MGGIATYVVTRTYTANKPNKKTDKFDCTFRKLLYINAVSEGKDDSKYGYNVR